MPAPNGMFGGAIGSASMSQAGGTDNGINPLPGGISSPFSAMDIGFVSVFESLGSLSQGAALSTSISSTFGELIGSSTGTDSMLQGGKAFEANFGDTIPSISNVNNLTGMNVGIKTGIGAAAR